MMNNHFRRLIVSFGPTLALLFASPSHAFLWQPTEIQFALLPAHCKASIARKLKGAHWDQREVNHWKGQSDVWESRIGADFVHMHHYCAGLGWLTLAENPSMRAQTNYSVRWSYARAVGEISYTIGRSNPSSPLWTEMNLAQARARAGLARTARAEGDDDLASKEYDRAASQLVSLQRQSPGRADIYIELAKLLDSEEKVTEAIDVLEQGMEKVSKKGPLLFYLARYYYSLGDLDKAAALTTRAEAAGMKMDSLRRKLGSERSTEESTTQPASKRALTGIANSPTAQ
jgi:tetratricopeptide (TPR) repeat protein